jgi:hypothetical protein
MKETSDTLHQAVLFSDEQIQACLPGRPDITSLFVASCLIYVPELMRTSLTTPRIPIPGVNQN